VFLIRELLPDLVVVDSLNMVANIRSPDDIKEAMQKWKEVTQEVQCHSILIAHMNKKGEIKGTTDIPHLADLTCLLRKLDVPRDMRKYSDAIQKSGYFVIEIGKNRYGPSGGKVCFQHKEEGIEYKTCDLAG
jgi:predicted ATP-dependent serine protease